MIGTYFHGVWLWNVDHWEPVQATGPLQMDQDYAFQMAAADPYTQAPPLPYAWAGLWALVGGAWRLDNAQANYRI